MKNQSSTKDLISFILKGFSFLLILFASDLAEAKTLKIAIIDTGMTENLGIKVKKCDGLDKDFTNSGLKDYLLHGSIIVALATEGNQNKDYCISTIKLFDKTNSNTLETVEALKYVDAMNFDVVNLSWGGREYNALENFYIKKLLDKGVLLVAAAGNEHTNLRLNCNYFPACYDKRIFVIGSLNSRKEIAKSSNYDSSFYTGNTKDLFVDYYFMAEDLSLYLPNDNKIVVSGSSFAAPQFVNIIIKKLAK